AWMRCASWSARISLRCADQCLPAFEWHQASAKTPFALSVACDSKRTRGSATDGADFEERGSRSVAAIPFDSGPPGLRSGRTVKSARLDNNRLHTRKALALAFVPAQRLNPSSPAHARRCARR